MNFLILVLTVSVLGFAHRLRSPGRRLSWWLASLAGAWGLTIAVNTLRIVAAVELYRSDPVAGLTAGAGAPALGIVLYLGALWGDLRALDRLDRSATGGRAASPRPSWCPALYLGMTVGVPLLNGALRAGAGTPSMP